VAATEGLESVNEMRESYWQDFIRDTVQRNAPDTTYMLRMGGAHAARMHAFMLALMAETRA
jgi:hypothetical protein